RLVVASAWAVDASHRRASLQLATAYFRQRNVDVLLNTTAVEATSGKAFLAFGADRVPQPAYTEELLWVTGYRGFAAGQLRKKGVPAADAVSYPAAAALWIGDAALRRNSFLRARADGVRQADGFDER